MKSFRLKTSTEFILKTLCVLVVLTWRLKGNDSRQLINEGKEVFYTDDGVCMNARLYPTLHDSRPSYHDMHKQQIENFIKSVPMVDRDLPQLSDMTDGNYCVWNVNSSPLASAWNDSGDVVQGPGWKDPGDLQNSDLFVRRQLEGNYVAFFSWFFMDFGHFMHDNLPTIAWLRATVPPNTKFILPDVPIAHEILQFLDPDFYRSRIEWVALREVVQIQGTLTVVTPDVHPIVMGHRLMDYLRNWIIEKHPQLPERRMIVYYSRNGDEDAQTNGRTLEPNHENEVIKTIRSAMHRNHVKEHLVVYNGHENNGNAMSIERKFELFRSAKTIIGPHGSGMVNMLWADPRPMSCEWRTQVLEFISGPDSIVHHRGNFEHNYYNVFRGMPLDYHHIVYTKESDSRTTYVHLNELTTALDVMWNYTKPESIY